MNLETILLISIATFPLIITLCVLITKRGLYWINGQAIIPSPNQTINIVSINEITSTMSKAIGRYTKVFSFFGNLRIDPNFDLSKLLIEEYEILKNKQYAQQRFSIDLVDCKYMNSMAIKEFTKFLLYSNCDSIEIKFIFPCDLFTKEFINFQKFFIENKNITIERARHVQE